MGTGQRGLPCPVCRTVLPLSAGTVRKARIVAPELKHLAGGFSPLDLHNVISRVIVPALKEKKLTWKPLKAGRTGACTEVIERSNGNAALAQALLGHKDVATTTGIYKKQVSLPALRNGMRLLDGNNDAERVANGQVVRTALVLHPAGASLRLPSGYNAVPNIK